MGNPEGEAENGGLSLYFDGHLRLEFRGGEGHHRRGTAGGKGAGRGIGADRDGRDYD